MDLDKLQTKISNIFNETGAYEQVAKLLEDIHLEADDIIGVMEDQLIDIIEGQLEAVDLVDKIEELPQELQTLMYNSEAIIEQFGMAHLHEQVIDLGYIFDWDMDGTIYDLKLIIE